MASINGKAVYVVRGSEDGVLGVFTQLKGAYEKAMDYLAGEGVFDNWDKGTTSPATYSRFCKNLRDHYTTTIRQSPSWGSTEVETEIFYLNHQ